MASLIRVVLLSCSLLLFCSTQNTSFFVHGEELIGERKPPSEVLLSITQTTSLVADGEELERELRAPKRSPPPPSRNPPPPPPPPPRVRHYTLALSWPISVCRVDSRPCTYDYGRFLPRTFTLHGLWPNINETCDRKININDLTPYTTRLKSSWPNIKKFTSPSISVHLQFWLHEYTKHGTCVGSLVEYFKKTLDFYDTHDLATLHTLAKIVPGTGTLKVLDIEKEIKNVTRTKPILICNKAPKTGADQLVEIRFRLNTKMEFQPPIWSSNCGAEVVFPG